MTTAIQPAQPEQVELAQKDPKKYLPNGARRITIWNGLGFGVGDVFGGGSGALTGTYLSLFLTSFAGLSIAQAQSIQGVATMLSAVTAIIIGGLSDSMYKFKIGRKLGRRRMFILLGAPLLVLGMGMWLPGFSYWFYFASFFCWTVTLQIIMIPYATLPSEMTTDFNGRTILSTTRMFMSGLAGSLVPIVGAALLNTLGNHAGTYTVIGVGIITVFILCVLCVYFTTWERKPEELDPEDVATGEKKTMREHLSTIGHVMLSYLSTLRVRAFRQHMAIYLIALTFVEMFMNVFMFFTIYAWNETAAFASLLLSLGVIWMPASPLQGWLFSKLGANGLYSVTFAGTILGIVSFYFLHLAQGTIPDHTWVIVTMVVFALFLFFKSLIYFVPWQVFPFIPDVDEIMTRHRREGVFSSMMRFLRVLTQGLGAMFIGFFLQNVGFNATKKQQTPEALNGLITLSVWIVIAGLAVAWAISLTLRLNKKTHAVLIGEIDRLKAGGSKADVKPEVRKVVENLTGIKYDKCWPDEPAAKTATVQ